MKVKLKSGGFTHRIEDIGKTQEPYVVKYVMDLEMVPVIREIQIHKDGLGMFSMPPHHVMMLGSKGHGWLNCIN